MEPAKSLEELRDRHYEHLRWYHAEEKRLKEVARRSPTPSPDTIAREMYDLLVANGPMTALSIAKATWQEPKHARANLHAHRGKSFRKVGGFWEAIPEIPDSGR